VALGVMCAPPGHRPCNSGSVRGVAPGGEEVLLGGLHSKFAWRRLGCARRYCCKYGLCVLFIRIDANLDQEMLCHEWVGSWMVVNT